MSRFSLIAVGADRPGIVAGVAGALHAAQCNLEDSSMTILEGQFAVLLIVGAPASTTAQGLEAALGDVAARFGLVVVVRPLDDEGPAAYGEPEAGELWVVTLRGADRPGIVHEVAGALAGAGANIVDLATRLVGEPPEAVYVMTMRVLVAEAAEAGEPQAVAALRDAAARVGVHCSASREDPDLL